MYYPHLHHIHKVNGDFIGADGGVGNAKFDAKLKATNAEVWFVHLASHFANYLISF